MPYPEEITSEITKLERVCDHIVKEAGKEETEVNRLRICTVRNILTVLIGMRERPSIMNLAKARKMMTSLRQRVRELHFNPKATGSHNFALKNGE